MKLPDHITFVAASTEDADSMLSLIYQLEHVIPKEALLNNLKNSLPNKDYRLFVAKDNEWVIAFAELHFMHFIYEEKKRARLTIYCVDEKSRNQKIGSRFLNFLEKFCVQNDVFRIELTSNIRRIHAHRFYEQNGYSFISKAFHKNL